MRRTAMVLTPLAALACGWLAGTAIRTGPDERPWADAADATGGDSHFPVWAPDSRRVAFAFNGEGAFNLFTARVDDAGGAALERLTRSPNWQFPFSWSSDGRFIAYTQQEWAAPAGRNYETWIRGEATRRGLGRQ